ncbi:MAG UNVERIFIED_CONTAM: DUF1585 domain-containing protein [Planctomycetaceae bacterium]
MFALGRELNKFDACVVETSVKKLQENGYQSRILIEEIACSYPFRNRYYKKSDPPPDLAGGRGSRLFQALQRFSEKAAEARRRRLRKKLQQRRRPGRRLQQRRRPGRRLQLKKLPLSSGAEWFYECGR